MKHYQLRCGASGDPFCLFVPSRHPASSKCYYKCFVPLYFWPQATDRGRTQTGLRLGFFCVSIAPVPDGMCCGKLLEHYSLLRAAVFFCKHSPTIIQTRTVPASPKVYFIFYFFLNGNFLCQLHFGMKVTHKKQQKQQTHKTINA